MEPCGHPAVQTVMKTLIAIVVCAFASAALAGFCDKCKELAFTADVGQCTQCKGFTSSGSHKLCGKCGDKLAQCEHCAAALGKPATRKAELSEQAKELAAKFKDSAGNFGMSLTYYGNQEKPYYNLLLSAAGVPEKRQEPFNPAVGITREQAEKLIDVLAEIGYFDDAMNIINVRRFRHPTGPTYVLTLSGPRDIRLHLDLGWNKAMHAKLEAIQASLDGEARKAMDMLIARLSGHLKEWK